MHLHYRQACYPWVAQPMHFVSPRLGAAWYFQGVMGSRQQRWPRSRHRPCFFDARGRGAEAKRAVLVFGRVFCTCFWAASCPGMGCWLTGTHEAATGHDLCAFSAGASHWGTDHVKGRMLSSTVPRELCLGKEKASWNSPRHKSCRSTAAPSEEGHLPIPRASACLRLFRVRLLAPLPDVRRAQGLSTTQRTEEKLSKVSSPNRAVCLHRATSPAPGPSICCRGRVTSRETRAALLRSF